VNLTVLVSLSLLLVISYKIYSARANFVINAIGGATRQGAGCPCLVYVEFVIACTFGCAHCSINDDDNNNYYLQYIVQFPLLPVAAKVAVMRCRDITVVIGMK